MILRDLGNSFSQALPLFLDRMADPITAVVLSVTFVLCFGEVTIFGPTTEALEIVFPGSGSSVNIKFMVIMYVRLGPATLIRRSN